VNSRNSVDSEWQPREKRRVAELANEPDALRWLWPQAADHLGGYEKYCPKKIQQGARLFCQLNSILISGYRCVPAEVYKTWNFDQITIHNVNL
jgi:hypothetical protein